jgi:HK97 family phage major capsid protein
MRKQKLERWEALVKEQRSAINSAKENNYDVLKEDSYQARAKEIADIGAWLEADKQLEVQERSFDHSIETRSDSRTAAVSEDDTYTRSLARYMTGNNPNGEGLQMRADMTTLSSGVGGALVQTSVSAEAIEDLKKVVRVRQLGAETRSIEGPTNVPLFAVAPAVYISEGSTQTATDPTTSAVTLRPTLLQCNTTFTHQLEKRSVVDIKNAIRNVFVEGVSQTENSKFLYGTGTNEPEGLVYGVSATSAASSGTTFTDEEFMACYWGVAPDHRTNGTWLMSSGAQAIVATFTDAADNSLLIPNFRDGIFQIWGRPVIVDDNMNAVTTGLKPVVFADVPRAYIIGEEENITVFFDPYSKASTGKNVLYLRKYNDGRVKKAAAGKALLMG